MNRSTKYDMFVVWFIAAYAISIYHH